MSKESDLIENLKKSDVSYAEEKKIWRVEARGRKGIVARDSEVYVAAKNVSQAIDIGTDGLSRMGWENLFVQTVELLKDKRPLYTGEKFVGMVEVPVEKESE